MNEKSQEQGKILGGDGRIIRKTVLLFLTIGLFTFLIAIAALFGGKMLDERFNTGPWLMAGLGILGILASLALTLSITLRSLRTIQTLLSEKNGKEAKK